MMCPSDMMRGFAEKGSSSVVLPSDFREATSMFEQMMAANAAPKPEREPEARPQPRPHDPTGNGNHKSHE